MPGRSRTRLFHHFHGTGGNTNDSVRLGGDMIVQSKHVCDDVTGAGDNNNFGVYSFSYEGGRLYRPRSQFGNHMEGYVADYLLQEGSWSHFTPPGLLSNLAYAAQLAARTNPSRPYVDVPVTILELGDFTQLIRDSGRNILQKAAGNHLKIEFGIKPLASDLAKLTTFRREFKNRKREIERLAGPKGLRRTVDLGSAAHGGDDIRDFQTNLALVTNRRRTWLTKENVRGHIRWKAAPEFHALSRGNLDSLSMERLIQRTMLGITNYGVDASTLWEALPWSWLIDWGSTVGSYLAAKRNIIPAQLHDIRIMRHTHSEWTWKREVYATNPEGYMSAGIRRRDNKSRSQSLPVAPVAHFPFLSGKQVGILSSLAVTRMR
nr:MAG: hypothetical protein 1 [Leviviridae sp.]